MKKKHFVLPILPILLVGLIMSSNAQNNTQTNTQSNTQSNNTPSTNNSDSINETDSINSLANSLATNSNHMVYQFNETANIDDWQVVNDGVMGGMSLGQLKLNDEGHGVFTGNISLENYGGFTSIRHRFEGMTIDDTISKVVVRVKGDGKRYQVRLKEGSGDKRSYITHIETTGEWQTIEIPLNSMYPTFRGMKLPLANFEKSKISEVGFLIANKKQESFELVIDSVVLQ